MPLFAHAHQPVYRYIQEVKQEQRPCHFGEAFSLASTSVKSLNKGEMFVSVCISARNGNDSLVMLNGTCHLFICTCWYVKGSELKHAIFNHASDTFK